MPVKHGIAIDVKIISLDSTNIKVHPDGMGALKKTALSQSERAEEAGTQRYIWLARLIETP